MAKSVNDTMDTVARLDDMFDFLSTDILGGTTDTLDGFVTVEASSFVIDWGSFVISLSGVRIETLEGIWIDYPTEHVLLNLSSIMDNDFWENLLPQGNRTIETTINATTILHNASSPHAV